MTGRLSIGYRHILPGIPFLIMVAGHSVLWRPSQRLATPRLLMLMVGVMLLWHAISALRTFPHYEAYFNELVGGPANGHRILVDSNLDWGQDLPALKQFLDDKNLDKVYLSYFGTAPPEEYGIVYRPLPSFPRFIKGKEEKAFNPYTPQPGWYAISATSLRLGLYLQDRDLYAYFSEMEPKAQAGYSINLYEVQYPEDTSIERDVVVDQAVWDTPEEQYNLLPNQRLVTKWTQSANSSITWSSEEIALPSKYQSLEVDFGDAFSLLGFAVEESAVRSGDPLEMTLVWQVKTASIPMPSPTTADPLAMFIHISSLDDPGNIVAQYDGWDTALTGLENGDIIIQAVQIQVPEDTAPDSYQLQIGLYSPQSRQRLHVTSSAEPTDVVTLTPITIVAEERP
jgi:hypothetical protein